MVSLPELLSSLLQANNIVLLIVLVTVFIIGYKVLQTVVQLLLISLTSGGFMVALSYLGMGPKINLSNIFSFMIIGVSLYLIFSSIQLVSSIMGSIWSTVKSIIPSGNRKKKSEGNQKKIILTESEDDD